MPFFQTKLRPEDFIVTEILDKEPSGEGDYHYILIEKKWLTTFLLIDLMIKDLWFNRNMIGIAGLKDKNAITRQWISISKRDVAKYVGWVNDLLSWMRQKWKIIKATYAETMLKLGNNAGNHFDLTLVGTAILAPEKKKEIETFLDSIEKKWIPNFFGDQRFGYWGTNWKIWHELLAWTLRNIKWDVNTLAEKRFKVQAFASYVFNQYVLERDKKWLLYKKMAGDVIWKDKVSVTWPVPGDDLELAKSDAGKLEKEVFEKTGLTKELFDRFKVFGLFWIRRSLLVFPKKIKYTWRWKILFLAFDLPSGAYATVLIDEIEKILRWGLPKPPVEELKWDKRYHNKPEGFELKKHDTPKPKPKRKVVEPWVNPYTGQKINTDKAKTRAFRAQKKEEKQKMFPKRGDSFKKKPKA